MYGTNEASGQISLHREIMPLDLLILVTSAPPLFPHCSHSAHFRCCTLSVFSPLVLHTFWLHTFGVAQFRCCTLSVVNTFSALRQRCDDDRSNEMFHKVSSRLTSVIHTPPWFVGKRAHWNYKSSNKKPNLHLVDRKFMSSLLDGVFPHSEDKYDGVIIDYKSLPSDTELFTDRLKLSLDHWRVSQKRGVWLKLPLDKAKFVPIAADMGFAYHHAEKNYVMMTHWLAESEDRLPANASHQVGVGCIVVHEGKLLVVQEKSGPLRGTGVWKIPTGLVDAGEEISDAAMREVEEETGIKTTFQKVLCFRHAHSMLFGKSDIFLVCVLSPNTFDITHQEAELVACEWKDPEEFFKQSFFLQSPVHTLLNDLIRQEVESILAPGDAASSRGIQMEKLAIGWRPGAQTVYYVSR